MTLSHISPDEFPKYIQLQGLPGITRTQFGILLQLYDDTLPDTHQVLRALVLPPNIQRVGCFKSSARTLQQWDYVVGTRDGTLYYITSRGVHVLKAILARCLPKDAARQNNLCFRCRQNPRHQMPSKLHSWCLSCIQSNQRRAAAEGQRQTNAHLPCARCKTGTRYISDSGLASQYCKPCKIAAQKGKRQRDQSRRRARIESGEVLLCKCGAPVYVTPHYVSKRCKACEWENTRIGSKRRALRSVQTRKRLERTRP